MDKTHDKDREVSFTFRLPESLRERFAAHCAARDLTASQGLRALMQAACDRDTAQAQGKTGTTRDPLDPTRRL